MHREEFTAKPAGGQALPQGAQSGAHLPSAPLSAGTTRGQWVGPLAARLPFSPPGSGHSWDPGTPVLCSFPPRLCQGVPMQPLPATMAARPQACALRGGGGRRGNGGGGAVRGRGQPRRKPLASHRPWLVTRGDGGCRAFPLRAGEGKSRVRGFEGCESTSCCYSSQRCLSAMQENPESSDLAQLL